MRDNAGVGMIGSLCEIDLIDAQLAVVQDKHESAMQSFVVGGQRRRFAVTG